MSVAKALEALEAGDGLLIVGGPGTGKSAIGDEVREKLNKAVMGSYSGSAKELLEDLAEQLGCPIEKEVGENKDGTPKTKPMTAPELKAEVGDNLKQSGTVLICDDADRWPVSLRYWLESLQRREVRLLLLASNPPRRDIFLKLPRIEMDGLSSASIREIMIAEATDRGLKLSITELAMLEARSGGNPALARRAVAEHQLGLTSDAADHREYVDGTPLLIVLLGLVSILRYVGMATDNRTLYVIGGICMILAIALRILFTQANRGGYRSRLGN